jgi:hypothetical protein
LQTGYRRAGPAKLKKSGRPPFLPNKLTNADCGF